MAAKITNPGTQTFDAPREHRSFRLDTRLIAIIEDIAMGVEAGESGLKSCAMGAVSAAALGASAAEVNAAHHHELAVIDDEDECFNAIGDMLAKGFSYEEIAKRVTLGGGATHLLALERWCDRVRLECDCDSPPAEALEGFAWSGSALHERRQRGHRAFEALRRDGGTTHASVLHIVYGWPDPFVGTLSAEVRVALGRELAPLARYTDAVEEKRREMVRSEAARGAKTYVPAQQRPFPIHGHEEQLIGLSAAIAMVGENRESFRLAAKHGLRHEGSIARDDGYKLFDLERARSLTSWYDRNLTSGDAVRSGVGPFLEPMPIQGDLETGAQWEARKEARKVRRLEHEARVDAFVTNMKLDANRMLTEASTAFFGAWLSS